MPCISSLVKAWVAMEVERTACAASPAGSAPGILGVPHGGAKAGCRQGVEASRMDGKLRGRGSYSGARYACKSFVCTCSWQAGVGGSHGGADVGGSWCARHNIRHHSYSGRLKTTTAHCAAPKVLALAQPPAFNIIPIPLLHCYPPHPRVGAGMPHAATHHTPACLYLQLKCRAEDTAAHVGEHPLKDRLQLGPGSPRTPLCLPSHVLAMHGAWACASIPQRLHARRCWPPGWRMQ